MLGRIWSRKRTFGENEGNLNTCKVWILIVYKYWFINCDIHNTNNTGETGYGIFGDSL